ncbi:TetR/AcrR family transcriptional regulator [Xanthobacter sp. VTT E-85241]|uniref:TetR/AcrR family transcriptional regulator n=1 Tax=Roseixanthobacter finlandensis TaxID=3119922 RepID=UPI0037276CE0
MSNETSVTKKNAPPLRRGRPKVLSDEMRRRAIVKAAHETFIELGFGRTTTAAVAARAKVSKRAIYQFFKNQTELFAAVVKDNRHMILDLPRPAGEDLSLMETLVRIFRLDIDDDAEKEREAILQLITRESSQFPELSDYLYKHQIIRSREDLIEWLENERLRGRITVEDPLVNAGMLMDIVFGALLPRRRLQNRIDRARRTEHIKKRLEIYLRGTAP